MDLSCIIVNYKTKALTAQCIQSLIDSVNDIRYEIIVVDNDSGDGSIEYLRDRFRDITVLDSGKNGGFAYANNIGMSYAKGRYILLLNSDTLVHPGALEKMLDYMEAHPEVGVLSSSMVDGNGRRIPSGHAFAQFSFVFIQTFKLKRFLPRSLYKAVAKSGFRSAALYASSMESSEAVSVDWVTGACMMIRKEVYTSVGGLDETYFMYMEDEDWCRRIKALGWKVMVLPAARIVHLIGKSGCSSPKVLFEQYRSAMIYHLRYNRKRFKFIKPLLMLQARKAFNRVGSKIGKESAKEMLQKLEIEARTLLKKVG